MKFASILGSLIALTVTCLDLAIAASDKSAVHIVNAQQSEVANCSKNEIGKITKVDVLFGREVGS